MPHGSDEAAIPVATPPTPGTTATHPQPGVPQQAAVAVKTSGAIPGGRRRIDRVLGEGFAEHLEELPMDELRSRRKDAEQEETDLSYLRRLIQGRLDLVNAEVQRRGGAPQEDLIASLTHVLSEGTTRSSNAAARFIAVEPSRLDERRRRVEKVVADVDLSNAASMTDEQIGLAVVKLRELETSISHDRRLVQQVMDLCTAEIGRRYKEGDATVDDLLHPHPHR